MLKVVIPCYDEPDALATIKSLWACNRGDFAVEIVVVINSYNFSAQPIVEQNRLTYSELTAFAAENNSADFYLTVFNYENLPGHQTGAGIPRKIGMDYAADKFFGLNCPNGIIAATDADALFDSNYLQEIYRNFTEKSLKSATIHFHHPTEHLSINDPIRISTESYEEYLHYFRAALQFIAFPYPYYTIGSCFAVTADTYRKVGGMGRQQAGEDFYFLHKVFPLGKTDFIDTTCVYPAARISYRVPFGTGPEIGKMIEKGELHKKSYQAEAFEQIRKFIVLCESFYDKNSDFAEQEINNLPDYFKVFLEKEYFTEKIAEIKRYTTNFQSYRKRFFSYFNALKIIQLLNVMHVSQYKLSEVRIEYPKMLAMFK
ncbi:MAG: hypothetical protein LBV75_05475 [Paludibacter sp.]|jgi:hypothetical protein|nr:hypothetical protein [Paludibacter sp.]